RRRAVPTPAAPRPPRAPFAPSAWAVSPPQPLAEGHHVVAGAVPVAQPPRRLVAVLQVEAPGRLAKPQRRRLDDPPLAGPSRHAPVRPECQPPRLTRSSAMPQKPVSVTVLAIIGIVWFAWGLCGYAMSAGIFASGGFGQPNPALDLMRQNPVYWNFTMVS